MKWNLKSLISLIITIVLSISFSFIVFKMIDEEMAKSIITTYLTIATSVIGFFIGYQTNKKSQSKEDDKDE